MCRFVPDRVALLVPAYRAGTYLPRLAAAARAQLQPFAEWHCYDDASGDDTAAVAVREGFHVIAGPTQRGPSFARNRLAEAATAEWVHFHDADDLLAPEYLSHVLAAASPAVDVVVCDSSWELEATRERIIHRTYSQSHYEAAPLAYVLTHPIGVISGLIRRSAFTAIGGFDEATTCWEDADLFVRLVENGARFQMVPETLVTSLRHERGISRNQHHCDRCRLKYLRAYATRQPPSVRPQLAAEAETLIPRFLGHRDRPAARDALALCRELGVNPPSTTHPGLRLLKKFVPALWLVRLQQRHRATSAR